MRLTMRQLMNGKGLAAVALTALTLSAVTLFQNCSEPLPKTESDLNSLAQTLPFAFDNTVDTIAYMSCAGGGSGIDKNAIWSYRAAAFSSGTGLRLNDAFYSAVSSYSPADRAELIAQSPRNAGAVLQMSLRQTMAYGNIVTSGGSSAMPGDDYVNFVGPLDDPHIAGPLAQLPRGEYSRMNYFSGVSGLTGRRVDGALHFNDSEADTASTRGYLNGGGALMTVGYADSASSLALRAPDGSTGNRIFGRGYQLNFTTHTPGDDQPRVLAAVGEYNLETNSPVSATWYCPQYLHFWVARSCGENGCACNNDPYGDPTAISIARRVLPAEHWYIDATPGKFCIVQKTATNQCYKSDFTGTHYVSICVRN